ncbi:MAG: FKBP-type peptidyl-prolyl cis-trans isomerase [Novosphingobium sp.]|nr:FKBP-type peptidyl-prolyl cis-trans isomerase [Novosphingobium sp.]
MKKIALFISIFFAALLLLNFANKSTNPNKNNIKKESTKVTRKKLDSGLEYEIIKEGNADNTSAQKGDKVTVNYTGWLDNNGELGTKFDSSLDRNQPFSFKLGAGQVIQGWDEGVVNMKIGEKRRLFIPSKLGYGAYGAGNIIPANANLIFDVELLSKS